MYIDVTHFSIHVTLNSTLASYIILTILVLFSDTLIFRIISYVPLFLFLLHFDFKYDQLLKRYRETWNRFLYLICHELIISVNVLFIFLDTNGDDYLDTGELEALFVKEVSVHVIYKPDAYTL